MVWVFNIYIYIYIVCISCGWYGGNFFHPISKHDCSEVFNCDNCEFHTLPNLRTWKSKLVCCKMNSIVHWERKFKTSWSSAPDTQALLILTLVSALLEDFLASCRNFLADLECSSRCIVRALARALPNLECYHAKSWKQTKRFSFLNEVQTSHSKIVVQTK